MNDSQQESHEQPQFLEVSLPQEKLAPAAGTDSGVVAPRKKRVIKRRNYQQFLAHLHSKIDKNGPGGCWLFTGGLSNGYACISFEGKVIKGSRVMLAEKLGRPLGHKMEACHTCDNPACLNPDHLFEGTHIQNMHDMRKKGRDAKALGTAHPNHKLKDEQAAEIRRLYARGDVSMSQLGARYGVHKTTIGYVVNRTKWKHVK
jgi:hypothetical protein